MPAPASMTPRKRRDSIALSYANAALWGAGNGVASTSMVTYLARELRSPQIALGVALLRAGPQLIGLLRLGAPTLIDRLVDRRRVSIASFQFSALALLLVPFVGTPGRWPSASASLWYLVGLWSLYHLLEYVGLIALWSWLADLVPLKVRGSFIGRRNLWLVCGESIGMLSGGGLIAVWQIYHLARDTWFGYALALSTGAMLMLAATLPLRRMALAAPRTVAPVRPILLQLLRPFADRRYLRLLGAGVWISFFNGLTQSAQFLYQASVLGLSVLTMHLLAMLMEFGQAAVSPALGRLTDRVGNRPVMVVCQALVAAGPLYFLAATPSSWWWIIGASVVWIAYAGINIGLPNLMLKLAPGDDRPAYVASYFAVTGLAYALSTIAGGQLESALGNSLWRVTSDWSLSYYELAFITGALGRELGALLLLTLIEPGVGRDRNSKVGDRNAAGKFAAHDGQ